MLFITGLLSLAGIGLYVLLADRAADAGDEQSVELRAYTHRVGTFYGPAPGASGVRVTIRELELPLFAGANAIWGASGRDDQGHLWFGVSVQDEKSARLIEYLPQQDRFVDHGDPVTALETHGLARDGTRQVKIHSKIIQADDGHLYFSSMDEEGESHKTGALPHWGSNLWRYKPRESRWEHVFHAPEGLIAIAGVGRWIYALGYWDHVLYQYDTRTGRVSHIRVGSEGGHVSRNIIADINGHVYVPRLKYYDMPEDAATGSDESHRLLVATLMEYDTKLRVVNTFPLIHYVGDGRPLKYHGITAFTHMADHSIVFVTGTGYLYRIIPANDGPAGVEELGWIHPEGESYTAALFPLDGQEWLLGVGKHRARGKRGGGQYQVVLYNLRQRTSRTVPAQIPDYRYLLLYGSNTRDDRANSYLVGRVDWKTPIVWQLHVE
jgi:hypothetical protein